MASEETLLKIRELSILKVADGLNLHYSKNGKYRKCRCFMHDDKHPSLWLNKDDNTWYCPVCNIGGAQIDLVMRQAGKAYGEAIRWLARRFDILETQATRTVFRQPIGKQKPNRQRKTTTMESTNKNTPLPDSGAAQPCLTTGRQRPVPSAYICCSPKSRPSWLWWRARRRPSSAAN